MLNRRSFSEENPECEQADFESLLTDFLASRFGFSLRTLTLRLPMVRLQPSPLVLKTTPRARPSILRPGTSSSRQRPLYMRGVGAASTCAVARASAMTSRLRQSTRGRSHGHRYSDFAMGEGRGHHRQASFDRTYDPDKSLDGNMTNVDDDISDDKSIDWDDDATLLALLDE